MTNQDLEMKEARTKIPTKPHFAENATESYMTETQLDCPDLSEAVINSGSGFH